MRRLFFFISIVIILVITYLIIMNMTNSIDIHYLQGYLYTMDEENLFVSKTMQLSWYTLIILLSGIFAGAGIVGMFLSAQKDKVKAYKRE